MTSYVVVMQSQKQSLFKFHVLHKVSCLFLEAIWHVIIPCLQVVLYDIIGQEFHTFDLLP